MNHINTVRKYTTKFLDWFCGGKVQFIVFLLFIYFLYVDLPSRDWFNVAIDCIGIYASLSLLFGKVDSCEVSVTASKDKS